MKKSFLFFWYLLAFITTTMAQAADYQHVTGNMTNNHPVAGAVNRKLNSFKITDGITELAINDIQSTYTSPVYVDKTASKLTVQSGAVLKFSEFDWTGSWMHAYVYIDYNNDKVFDTVANNDGTVNNGNAYGEVVSYNFYQDKDINGNTGDSANAIKNSYSNTHGESKAVPAFKLPVNLPAGEYRVRVKIDWDNIDGNLGASDIASSNGCQCDFTLVVEAREVDYTPYSTGERTATINAEVLLGRKISAIHLNGASIAVPEEQRTQRYVDLTSESFTVLPGETLDFSVSTVTTVSWMHSYVYIDYEANGFDLTATTERPLGDLVVNSYNSNNEGGSFAPEGSFNAPATIGEYRMRYKMDWNSTNPAGSQSWEDNAGVIIDFILVVKEDEKVAAKAALKAAIDGLNSFLSSITVSNKVTEYSSSLDDADARFDDAKNFYDVINEETTVADIEEYTATVRAIRESYSENVLENGKFYYIYSACTNSGYADGYLYASLGDINYDFTHDRNERNGGCWEVTTTPTVKHIWECEIVDGVAYFKNLHTASYIKELAQYCPTRLSEIEKGAITINKLGDAQVNILVNGSQAHAQTGGGDYFFVPWDGGKNSPSAWYIEEVTTISPHILTVGVAEWSTLVLGYNAIIPTDEGFKAYTISSIDDGYLSLAEATGVLGANTAIIVNAPAGDYEFAYTTEPATVDANTDALNGSLYDKNITPTDGTAYILSKQGDVVAFYKAKLDVNTDTSNDAGGVTYETFMNNANKAYLMLPVAQAMSNSFRFSYVGGTTMVEEVETEDADVIVVYDLQGRRLEKISGTGMYIVNGKKVLVK